MDESLRDELLALREADQAFRERMNEEWAAEHERTVRIRTMLEEHGWPGRSLVGEEGSSAAWLLVQHADDDPAFQERALALMQAAVETGEADAGELAYLVDRVRVAHGRPQVYGTQWNRTGPHPIEDPDRLDERRTAAGLPPYAEYEEQMRRFTGS